jgi:hypothetical protein
MTLAVAATLTPSPENSPEIPRILRTVAAEIPAFQGFRAGIRRI